jgi:hypothetical protein
MVRLWKGGCTAPIGQCLESTIGLTRSGRTKLARARAGYLPLEFRLDDRGERFLTKRPDTQLHKVNEDDSLKCPKCKVPMRVIAPRVSGFARFRPHRHCNRPSAGATSYGRTARHRRINAKPPPARCARRGRIEFPIFFSDVHGLSPAAPGIGSMVRLMLSSRPAQGNQVDTQGGRSRAAAGCCHHNDQLVES